jgi:DNA polymerase elongation subunit (family B)
MQQNACNADADDGANAASSSSWLRARSIRLPLSSSALRGAGDLEFQALSWHAEDVEVEDDDDEDDEEDGDHHQRRQPQLAYMIQVFGVDAQARTVALCVQGFTPYFYVKVPSSVAETWNARHLEAFRSYVSSRLSAGLRPQMKRVKFVSKRDMWGFTNFQTFKFIRLDFASLKAYRAAIRVLNEPCRIPRLCHGGQPIKFALYESNMDPMIRFIHLANLKPCGWVRVPAGAATPVARTTSQVDVQAHWTNVKPLERDGAARFVVASFDIECMSETGDFPVARRDYTKMANELCLWIQKQGKQWQEYDVKKCVVRSILRALFGSVASESEGVMMAPITPVALLRRPTDMQKEKEAVEAKLEMIVDDVYAYLKPQATTTTTTTTTTTPSKIGAAKVRDLLNRHLPALEGDAIIQIGTTFHVYGEKQCCFKHILTLGSCDPIEGVKVEACTHERELLMRWHALISETNPDVLCGYNIFGFDMAYMVDRAEELGCLESFLALGRITVGASGGGGGERSCTRATHFQERKLSSSALGDNILKFIVMEGRVQVDLMKCVQRDHKLDSYKLDHVAHTFMGMNKHDVSPADIFRLQRGSSADRMVVADYCVQDCALCNHLTMKLEILANNMGMANVCLVPLSFIFMRGQGVKIFSLVLKQCKDDGYLIPSISKPSVLTVTFTQEDAAKRTVHYLKEGTDWRVDDYRLMQEGADTKTGPSTWVLVVMYNHRDAVRCLQETLTRHLYIDKASFEIAVSEYEYKKTIEECTKKLTVRPLKAKASAAAPTLLPTPPDVLAVSEREETMEEDGYEGAIVLDPEEGIYIDPPVSVLDYASLYPSSMISENLSHDCIVLDDAYDNLPGVDYLNIAYDIYEGTGDKKLKIGERVCRFVQLPDQEKGLIPRILLKLLQARKATRKRMQLRRVCYESLLPDPDQATTATKRMAATGFLSGDKTRLTTEKGEIIELGSMLLVSNEPAFDPFQLAILDGLQLAYKITANSLYGQVGARTSPIYLKDIAACTTATGRSMIMQAKKFLEEEYGHGARVVYGDTDSVFVTFNNVDAEGKTLTGQAAVKRSIEHAHAASQRFKSRLKAPHDLEYDKTFYPFVLLSKKRYVGNLYEEDETKCYQKSMGIVLKRRDNAPIVKRVYGGIIDILLNRKDIGASVEFLQACLQDMVNGKCPLEDLVVTKSLRADYKDPDRIAHKVLADRIGERDPGNRPQVNDRIPYVYVQVPPASGGGGKQQASKVLQGNRIETPSYIREKGLIPDYGFYITNQIMRPVLQIYALVVEQLEHYRKPKDAYTKMYADLLAQHKGNVAKAKDKWYEQREREVQQLLFDPVLRLLERKQTGQRSIKEFFKAPPKKQ